MCINATGHRTVSSTKESSALSQHLDSVTLLNDGRLRIADIGTLLDGAEINCTVFAEDGQLCGEAAATILLFRRGRLLHCRLVHFLGSAGLIGRNETTNACLKPFSLQPWVRF